VEEDDFLFSFSLMACNKTTIKLREGVHNIQQDKSYIYHLKNAIFVNYLYYFGLFFLIYLAFQLFKFNLKYVQQTHYPLPILS
jgi:hypothetical protein